MSTMSNPNVIPSKLKLEENALDLKVFGDEEMGEGRENDVCLLLQQRQPKLLAERGRLRGAAADYLGRKRDGCGESGPRNAGMVQVFAVLQLTLLVAASGADGLDLAREAQLQQHCPDRGEPLQDFTDAWLPGFRGDSKWTDRVSFVNGDWIDTSDQGRSLLPFINAGFNQSPEQLASFWATDVSSEGQNVDKLRVTGILWLAVTTSRDLEALVNPVEESRYFQSYPGFSLLSIAMDGYYMETDTERLLCMLGCTVSIPDFARLATGDNSSSGNLFVWDNKDKDCDYSLQLRYPRRISLATPAIRGQLSRLDGSSLDIKLSSGWKTHLPYNFDAGGLVGGACNRTSLKETMLDKKVFRGPFLCSILSSLVQQWEVFSVKLNWPCLDSHAFCSLLGPFRNARDYRDITDARLLIKNLRCFNGTSQSGDNRLSGYASSQVSAVIRLQGKFEDGYFAYVKTGCNNGLTLNAEGMWDQDSGVLCMAACRGNENDLDLKFSQRDDCDVRVCMYIPVALTILQRGIMVGTISSTRSFDANDAHTVTRYFYPLSFFLPFNAQERLPDYNEDLHYEYTKVDSAYAILARDEPSTSNQKRYFPKISSSLFKYPSLQTTNADYNLLRTDLVIQTSGKSSSPDDSNVFVEFDFVAMDDVLFRGWAEYVENSSVGTDSDYTKKLGLLKVAGKLKVGTIANISTEGLYDPKNGKMYMVGCRDVKEEWAVLSGINDLEEGLDCFVEVVMQYPAASLTWIASQSVKITISSTRPQDDPIYFAPVTVLTARMAYESQRRGIMSEKSLEGALSIITLTFMVLCLLGQGWHMEKYPESVAFVSLLMLGIQAVAFATPLITGVEALFAADKNAQVFPEEGYRPILYIVKILSLTALLVLLRLFERVWSARVRASSSLSEVNKVPYEKKVCLLWATFHTIGLLVVLISHSRSQTFDLADMEESVAEGPVAGKLLTVATTFAYPGPGAGSRDWQKELLEYGGLIQDLFLLPQVFGGVLWKVTGKPLRRFYYVGITLLRLFPHLYDRYRKSHFFPYFNSGDYMYANPNSDFFSHAGDIVIPLLSLVLAVAIWFQQSYSDVQWKGLFSRSAKYAAVPIESELANRRRRTTLSPISETMPILARVDSP